MSRRNKKSNKQKGKSKQSESSGSSGKNRNTDSLKKNPADLFEKLFGQKGPVVKFVLLFVLVMAVFYFVFYQPPEKSKLIHSFTRGYLNAYAWVSSGLIQTLGYDISRTANVIQSKTNSFSVSVVRGCDAMEAKALFVAGIIAFPITWRKKWIGLAVGLCVLVGLNIIRIVTLFITGMHARSFFDTMHIGIWQALFILLTIVIWLIWLQWAMKDTDTNAVNDKAGAVNE